MTDYLHTSVQERGSPEGHRENSNAINHLLDEVTQIDDRLIVAEDLLTLQVLIAREFAILDDNTGTFTDGQVIDNWAGGGEAHVDSLIQIDIAAGTFTIGADGLYEINVQLIMTGSGNNVDLNLFVHRDGGAGTRIGYSYQASQASDASITAVGYFNAVAGEVVTFTITGAGYTLELAQISIMLKTPALIAA